MTTVDPVRTGCNAVTDERVDITPGDDGLFGLTIVHERLRPGHVAVEPSRGRRMRAGR